VTAALLAGSTGRGSADADRMVAEPASHRLAPTSRAMKRKLRIDFMPPNVGMADTSDHQAGERDSHHPEVGSETASLLRGYDGVTPQGDDGATRCS
jgi:hypothetical protein